MADNILEISNLSAGYGERAVFSNFSMCVERGEKVVVTGSNGCGKTTLLRCIIGLIRPVAGKIVLNSDKIPAYCKQDFANSEFVISAEEVVQMGLYKVQLSKIEAKKRVEDSMTATGCAHLSKRLFSTLSGGEKQRVSLARCLCRNSDLILLDEPSSFLDEESLNTFLTLMKNLPKNISVIAVTHDTRVICKLGWREIRMSNE